MIENISIMVASQALTWWTVSTIFVSTRSAKTRVNTKQPMVNRITLSRSSVVAMIGGVYCPPATWIATSSEPHVKTSNERFNVITVSSNDRAPAIGRPRYAVVASSRPVRRSQSSTAVVTGANMA